MGLFEHFPYTNFHELNLDRIVELVKQLQKEMETLPDSVKEEIEPEIVNWISEYIQDAGIDVQNGVLRILPTSPVLPGGSVNGIQVGDTSYLITDPTLISVVDGIEQRTTTLEQDVQALEDAAPVAALKTFQTGRFYVKGMTGSDDNDGRTHSTAFKTVDRAMREWRKYPALWIYIEEGGLYRVEDYSVFSDRSLHITAEVDDVVLYFIDQDSLANGIPIYNSHWVLQSRENVVSRWMKIRVKEIDEVTDGHLYFDNCMSNFTRIEFEQYFSTNGGALNISNCRMNRLRSHSSNLILRDGCEFTNTDPASYCLDLDFSQAHVTGTITTANLSAQGSANGACVYMTGGYAFFGSLMMSANAQNYYYWYKGNQGAELHIAESRVATLDARAQAGHYTETGATLITYA